MADIESFIRRWRGTGGAERANYALFLIELCDLLGVPRPDPAEPAGARARKRMAGRANEYVFERAVRLCGDDGRMVLGRIDLYKHGSFVLEAKQSKKRELWNDGAFHAVLRGAGLHAKDGGRTAAAGRALAAWTLFMHAARDQAQRYARALETAPPFLIVLDVGHVIELYADFSGAARYAPFPDARRFRMTIEDLRLTAVRDRLRAVWLDPLSLDPSRVPLHAFRAFVAELARERPDCLALAREAAACLGIRPEDQRRTRVWARSRCARPVRTPRTSSRRCSS